MSKSSDSDATPDSDELAEIICKKRRTDSSFSSSGSRKKVLKTVRPIHAMSGSDSESDVEDSPNLNGKAKGLPSKIDKSPKHNRIGDRSKESKTDSRPLCQYGRKCFRKNAEHQTLFRHNSDSLDAQSSVSPDQPNRNQYGLFVTKVKGINNKFNAESIAVGIKDLLSSKMGTLVSSVQFSYMFDIPWLIDQYPQEFRSCPLILVHGEQRESKKCLEKQGNPFPNVQFCQAKLPIPFGTHHTKMMLLLYKEGMRVVIHTANMLPNDWHQKTQGVWVSPLFPKYSSEQVERKDSPTGFKSDLLQYLNTYESSELRLWCKHIMDHDLSSARVFLIGSVPGRHLGNIKSQFGHLKLRKVLLKYGSDESVVNASWPLVAQFSSIGSLGSTPDEWLKGEWFTSLATCRSSLMKKQAQTSLKLIFPSVDDVRASLEGYPAGANLPYSYKTAAKQTYLRHYMHRWIAERFGRSYASPHIKTYQRMSPDAKRLAWFLLTSANLSKAAWGNMEKNGEQLMIRSYELGVLFLPQFHECEHFSLTGDNGFPVPYDVSLKKYTEKDFPWIWDIPQIKAPDRHGNMWCPPIK